MWCCLSLTDVFLANFWRNTSSTSSSLSQCAASLLFRCRSILPFRNLVIDSILAGSGQSLSSMLMMIPLALSIRSSVLVIGVLLSLKSTRICLAFHSMSYRTLPSTAFLPILPGPSNSASWYGEAVLTILSDALVTLPTWLSISFTTACNPSTHSLIFAVDSRILFCFLSMLSILSSMALHQLVRLDLMSACIAFTSANENWTIMP